MPTTTSMNLGREWSTFSGTDVKVYVEGDVFGACQAVSYAVQREKSNIYVMGFKDARAIARGKRAIAGSVVALVLGQDPMYNQPFSDLESIIGNHELTPNSSNYDNLTSLEDLSLVDSSADPTAPESAFDATSVVSNYNPRAADYMDQLPPMTVAMLATNEHGKSAQARIYGVEFLNSAGSTSVDSQQIEQQYTYIALSMLPWKAVSQFDWDARAWETLA